jgi:hypothetical protein
MKKIVNCETGEIIERELNEDELAQQAIDEENFRKFKKEADAKAKAKADLLAKLGISEEEAQLLLS